MAIGFTYIQLMLVITIIWILVRVVAGLVKKKVDWKYELKLLTVYLSIALVTRLVYFPEVITPMDDKVYFYTGKYVVNRLNLRPFIYLKHRYQGWFINMYGNIIMFIPVGMVWPYCFKKLNNVFKVVLAGFGYSLSIELSQLFVFARGTDIDDLILNTFGALIGALLYFYLTPLLRKIVKKCLEVEDEKTDEKLEEQE
ncbi:MAG: VanZ family protein [Eubacterium sp.]|nr:VanZ family protein [Eubacterium sp.]